MFADLPAMLVPLALAFAGGAATVGVIWWRWRPGREGRHLNLLVRDLQTIGLGLLGRAQVLGGPVGESFAAESRRILQLADAAEQAGMRSRRPFGLQDEALPLGALLRGAVHDVGMLLGPGSRHWRLDPALEDMAVRADRRAMTGAIVQVLARAARETNEGEFIDIRAARTPGRVTIIIEDEGIGAAVADLAPAAARPTEASRGMGLGLSLAQSLVRAHGGELVLEAVPGIGARALVSLPAERVAAP